MLRPRRHFGWLSRVIGLLSLAALVACGGGPATNTSAVVATAPTATAAPSSSVAPPTVAPTATVAPPAATTAPPTATPVPPTPTAPPPTPTRTPPAAAKGPVPTVTAAANQAKLTVVNAGPLDDLAGFTGLYYGGEILNSSGDDVSNIRLSVSFVDEAGKVIAKSGTSSVGRTILRKDEQTIFIVSMTPKVDKWAGVQIETTAIQPVTQAIRNGQFPDVEFADLRAITEELSVGTKLYAIGKLRNTGSLPSDNPFVMVAGYDANNTLTHIGFAGGDGNYVEPNVDLPMVLQLRGSREMPVRLEAHLSVKDAPPGIKLLAMDLTQHAQVEENGATVFIGELVNKGQVEAGYIQVTITIYDASGKVIGTVGRATVASGLLAPGAKTVWRAVPSFQFGKVAKYEIRASAIPASDSDRNRQYNDVQAENVQLTPGNAGVVFSGELVNTGAAGANNIYIFDAAYDAGGRLIGVTFASPNPRTLPTGQRGTFKETYYGLTQVPAKHEVYIRAWKAT